MTADADSLQSMGALHSTTVAPETLCSSSNVDKAALLAYVRIAVAEFVPDLAKAEPVAGHEVSK